MAHVPVRKAAGGAGSRRWSVVVGVVGEEEEGKWVVVVRS
jgi:hypothetical protein